MTSRFYLLVSISFTLLLAGVALRLSGLVVLVIPLLVYLGSAVLHRPGIPRLEANRSLDRAKVLPQTPVEITLVVANSGETLEELDIQAPLPHGLLLSDGKSQKTTSLLHGEEIQLSAVLSGPRGEYLFGEIFAHSAETFGLFEEKSSFPAGTSLVIHPTPLRLKPLPIRPPQTRGFAGPIPSRQGGTGVDFFLVREYQPGDSQRQINWKVSARAKNDLYTTIYEQQRIADVGIILDSRLQCEVQRGEESLFEHSVRAAGALAEIFIQDGNRVGLLVYGAALQIAFPGMGKLQRERILQVLARADTGFSYALEKLDFLPTRFFPARSQIVLVSPLIADDVPVLGFLRARGYAVLVVSPNPVRFEAPPTPATATEELAMRCAQAERELMHNSLRRAGVQVVDWDVSQPLETLVRTALAISSHMGAAVQ